MADLATEAPSFWPTQADLTTHRISLWRVCYIGGHSTAGLIWLAHHRIKLSCFECSWLLNSLGLHFCLSFFLAASGPTNPSQSRSDRETLLTDSCLLCFLANGKIWHSVCFRSSQACRFTFGIFTSPLELNWSFRDLIYKIPFEWPIFQSSAPLLSRHGKSYFISWTAFTNSLLPVLFLYLCKYYSFPHCHFLSVPSWSKPCGTLSCHSGVCLTVSIGTLL